MHGVKLDNGYNNMSVNNSANFLSLLQTLCSQDSVQDLIISAAVSVKPFVGSDNNPTRDVTGFAKVLDYIGSLFNTFKFKPV